MERDLRDGMDTCMLQYLHDYVTARQSDRLAEQLSGPSRHKSCNHRLSTRYFCLLMGASSQQRLKCHHSPLLARNATARACPSVPVLLS